MTRLAKKKEARGKPVDIGTHSVASRIELLTDYEEDDAEAIAREIADPFNGSKVIADLADEFIDLSDHERAHQIAALDYAGFADRFLPHYFSVPCSQSFHPEYFSMLQDVEQHRTDLPTIIAGPREVGKSVCGNLLMPLHSICYPRWKINTHTKKEVDLSKRYFAFVSATKRQASDPVQDIAREMEENDDLIKAYGSFYLDEDGHKPSTRRWSQTRIDTNRGHRIEAFSRNSKFRGSRGGALRIQQFNIDDVEDDKSVKNVRRREDDVAWIMTTIIPAMDGDIGNILWLGTMLHPDSAMQRLIDFGRLHNWPTRIFRSYEDDPSTGKRSYLWPERFGKEWVERKLEQMPMHAFEQEYLQRPSDAQVEISLKDFSYYDPRTIQHLEGTKRLLVCIGVDPAARTTQHADYTAIVPIAYDRQEKTYYVLPIVNQRLGLDGKIKAILHEYAKVGAHQVGIESVAFQIALKEALDLQARERGIAVNTREIKQSTDKQLRISRLYPMIESGQIKFLQGDRDHATMVDQLLHLYTTSHDDAADALEIAVRVVQDLLLKRRVGGVHAAIL